MFQIANERFKCQGLSLGPGIKILGQLSWTVMAWWAFASQPVPRLVASNCRNAFGAQRVRGCPEARWRLVVVQKWLAARQRAPVSPNSDLFGIAFQARFSGGLEETGYLGEILFVQ